MTTDFEKFVTEKLLKIESEVAEIKTMISDATNFASDIIGNNPSLTQEAFESIKNTLGNFTSINPSPEIGEGSMEDIISSLSKFREQLSSIKNAISPEITGQKIQG